MVDEVVFSSDSSEWFTPRPLFRYLDSVIHFTLDPCATKENAVCAKYYTKEDDGLSNSWRGERIFMNPPFSKKMKMPIEPWIRKIYEECRDNDTLGVGLLPSRTSNRWWHDYVMKSDYIFSIKGRLYFSDSVNSAPFPSAVVVWDGGGRLTIDDIEKLRSSADSPVCYGMLSYDNSRRHREDSDE